MRPSQPITGGGGEGGGSAPPVHAAWRESAEAGSTRAGKAHHWDGPPPPRLDKDDGQEDEVQGLRRGRARGHHAAHQQGQSARQGGGRASLRGTWRATAGAGRRGQPRGATPAREREAHQESAQVRHVDERQRGGADPLQATHAPNLRPGWRLPPPFRARKCLKARAAPPRALGRGWRALGRRGEAEGARAPGCLCRRGWSGWHLRRGSLRAQKGTEEPGRREKHLSGPRFSAAEGAAGPSASPSARLR